MKQAIVFVVTRVGENTRCTQKANPDEDTAAAMTQWNVRWE